MTRSYLTEPVGPAIRFIGPWSPRTRCCAILKSAPPMNPHCAPRAKHFSAVTTLPMEPHTLTCVRGLIDPTGNSQMEQPKVSPSARSPDLTTIRFRIETRRHTLLG